MEVLKTKRKNAKITIGFVDFPRRDEEVIYEDEKAKFIYDRLSEYYDVEVTNKNPNIVFCDCYGKDFVKYPNAIRVSVCAEELFPDFNIYDYVITIFEGVAFKDRVLSLIAPIYFKRVREALDAVKDRTFTNEDLRNKTDFCSFVQSKGVGADAIRITFFEELSKYKKVNSGGRLLNNIGGPVQNKQSFEEKHKFSISFINAKNYTLQDRPLDAFAAKTIPIYWGNPDIGEVYNTRAFVNVMDYDSIDLAIEEIKRIDNDDDLYISIMNEPVFVEDISLESETKKFDNFLINIVENGTVQRSGAYWNRQFEEEIACGRGKFENATIMAKKVRPITRKLFGNRFGEKVKKYLIGKILNKHTNTIMKK